MRSISGLQAISDESLTTSSTLLTSSEGRWQIAKGMKSAIKQVETREHRPAKFKFTVRVSSSGISPASTFKRLAGDWKTELHLSSSINEIVLHPAYQRIIGMGWSAVPLILKELKSEPNQWFWALRAITGADPVDPKDAGRIDRMSDSWIAWGRKNGLTD